MLKGNVSTIVGQLYAPGDPRRDSGFSIFYMGINLGALISPLICGYIGERVSWRLGFGVAGLGMLAGLIQYLVTSRHLGSAGLHPASTGDPAKDLREKKSAIRAIGIGAAVVAVLAALGASGIVEINATMLSDGQGWCLLAISVVVFSWLIFFGEWSPVERKRSAAILVLFISLPPSSGRRSSRPVPRSASSPNAARIATSSATRSPQAGFSPCSRSSSSCWRPCSPGSGWRWAAGNPPARANFRWACCSAAWPSRF
jgi:MFS family permease